MADGPAALRRFFTRKAYVEGEKKAIKKVDYLVEDVKQTGHKWR
jgi:hypothetical protein